MSEVKRFSLDMQFAKSQVKHDSEGELCFYRDYAALQQKLDAVLAENAEIKSGIADITFMRDDDFFASTKEAQRVMGNLVNIKTPATDAILNEVRAEGVDIASDLAGQYGQQFKVGSPGWHKWKSIVMFLVVQAEKIRAGSTEGGV